MITKCSVTLKTAFSPGRQLNAGFFLIYITEAVGSQSAETSQKSFCTCLILPSIR